MNNNLTFLEAAEYVLREHDRPLSSKSIVSKAEQLGVFKSKGETPWKTFNSKISTDILNKKDDSIFMRVAEGVYALRDWKGKYPEYQAKRYVKKLYDEEIAVFSSEKLSELMPYEGLFIDNKDFSGELSKIIFPMRRSDAEQDYSVIQLISVFIVMYKGKILTHLRSKRLPESRLHGEYSLMLGGHLGMDDFMQLELGLDNEVGPGLAEGILLRELSEELILNTEPSIKRVGLLYDTSRDVSRQHIGLVYTVDIYEERFEIGERGFLLNAKFESVQEINERRGEFENWSLLILDNNHKLRG